MTTIVMTTWMPSGEVGAARLEAAQAALSSWDWGLGGCDLSLVIADDGSEPDYLERLHESAPDMDVAVVETPRLGTGGALNAGLRRAFDDGAEVILYAADDWELIEELDLRPSLAILRDRADIGMVRLGPTHPNLMITARHAAPEHGGWYGEYATMHGGIVFAHRPALHHRRMYDDIGIAYPEGVSALDAERWLNDRATARGWGCVHAPNVSLAGPWRHLDTVELGEDSPATLTERYAR